jgi:hypothetical protein
MGAGASYFDKGSQLSLTHEQRRRYKALFEDLVAKGATPQDAKTQVQLAYEHDRDAAESSVAVANNNNESTVKSCRRPSLEKLPAVGVEKTNSSGKLVSTALSARNPPNSQSNQQAAQSVRRRTLDTNPSEPTFVRVKDLRKQSHKEPVSARRKIDSVTTAMLSSPSDSHILTSQAISFLNDVKRKLTMDSLEAGAVPAAGEECAHYCELCRIICKTAAALDQHVKYSYVHAKALKEQEFINDTVERATHLATVLHRCLEIVKFGSRRAKIVGKGKSRAWVRWQWAFRKVRFENNVLRTANSLAQQLAKRHGEQKTMITPTSVTLLIPDRKIASTKLSSHSLLFEGTKFFWKGHETMDVHLFLHNRSLDAGGNQGTLGPNTMTAKRTAVKDDRRSLLNGQEWNSESIIEIVVFDGPNHRELERMYLKFPPLYRVNEEDIREEITKFQVEQAKRQREEATVNNYLGESLSSRNGRASLKKSIQATASLPVPKHQHRSRKDINHLRASGDVDIAVLVEFILSKLELTRTAEDQQKLLMGAVDGILRTTTSTISASLDDVVVDNGSVNLLLTPVSIHRRRMSTEAEISSVMSSFRNNAENLKALTKAASSAVGLSNSPVGRLPRNPEVTRVLHQSLSIKMAALDNPALNPDATGINCETLDTNTVGCTGSVFAAEWDDEPYSGSSESDEDDDNVAVVMME